MRKFKKDNPHTFLEGQILVQSDNNQEYVKSAASHMGHGHVLNLNSWRFKTDGTVLNKTSCVFVVWVMDTCGSFVIIQECVVLIIVKKATANYFIRLEVLCQVVTVRELELKRRKSYHRLVGKMTLRMEVVVALKGNPKIKRAIWMIHILL